MMHRATDWYGPDCSCCGGSIGYDVANPVRPLCHGCQPSPRADEIVRLIVSKREDRRLKWLEPGRRVRVVIGRVVPRIGPAGQRLVGETLRDRRRRIARAIGARMHVAGWTIRAVRDPNTYEPVSAH